jgi:hypothetical protein
MTISESSSKCVLSRDSSRSSSIGSMSVTLIGGLLALRILPQGGRIQH